MAVFGGLLRMFVLVVVLVLRRVWSEGFDPDVFERRYQLC